MSLPHLPVPISGAYLVLVWCWFFLSAAGSGAYTSGGGPVGASRIEKALGGCVIWENWSSLGSTYAGKSYNTWNASLKRWEQFWVDNSGGMIHFYGALKSA